MAMSNVGRIGLGQALLDFLRVLEKKEQEKFGNFIRFWITVKSGMFSRRFAGRPAGKLKLGL